MFKFLNVATKGHFPKTKKEFKIYLKISFPIIISFIFFTLNNVVDNFQVTGIDGGVEALGIANTWTNLLFSCFIAIAYITISTFAQFYGAKKYKQARDSIKFRLLLLLSVGIIFVVFAQAFARQFIELLGPGQKTLIINLGERYLRLITISWFLLTITSLGASILQQVGEIKSQFLGSMFALITNIIFNIIFINVLRYSVEGAAYASILARLLAFLWYYSFLYWKHPKLFFKARRIFKIDSRVWAISKKRFFFAFLVLGTQLTITTRYVFWNYGYKDGSIGNTEYGLSAASILGIVGAIANIVLATLNSVDTTVGIFVARQLGLNNIKKAKQNARALKGFNTFLALCFSTLGVVFIVVVPQATFLVRGRYEALLENSALGTQELRLLIATGAQQELLKQIQISLIPIVILAPSWTWFITSGKSIASGKYNEKFSIIELIINIVQYLWLLITTLIISKYLIFWQAYWVFFISDLLKIIPYEFFFYKANWATSLTTSQENEKSHTSPLVKNKLTYK